MGVLDYLGKNEEAETSMRTLAEQQPDKLEPWLALVRFHATQHRARAATDSDRRQKVEEILEEIKPLLKSRWPDELLAAECRFAAADWPAADKAFEAALKRYPQLPEVQAAEARYRAHKGGPRRGRGMPETPQGRGEHRKVQAAPEGRVAQRAAGGRVPLCRRRLARRRQGLRRGPQTLSRTPRSPGGRGTLPHQKVPEQPRRA